MSSDGTQSIIQALRADGEQLWQTTIPTMLNNAVPDGFGGLIVTTCVSGSPLTVMDLDATGQPVWQVQSAQVRGYGYICYAPQIAVDGSGVAYIAEPTNAGLPSITEAYPNTSIQSFQFPPSIVNNTAIQCCVGPPMVNTDGTMYVEYEVRNTTNNVITSDTLYFYNGTNGQPIVLGSTTQDQALLAGPIIPDGQGGVLATWTISPSHSVLQYPYQAADVTNGVVGTPYNLPFSPLSVAFGQSPTLVLGENGTAFARGTTTTSINGVLTPVDQIVSFNLSSGAPNWTYQTGAGSTLSIMAVISDGSLAVNDSQNGVIQISTTGSATPLTGALGSVPALSWKGAWYLSTAQGISGISLPLQVDDADVWSTMGGNPGQNGLPNASCGCLAQAVQTPIPGGPKTVADLRSIDSLPEMSVSAPVPPNCPICALQSPQCTTQGSGPTYLIVIGDEGLNNPNGNNYDVGYGFGLVAQQKANDLQAQGNSAIACRVSTVQQFSNALTQNGVINGDVIYYGHSGLMAFGKPPTAWASELFVGQGSGDNTNVAAYNITVVCDQTLTPPCNINNYLSSNTAIRLNGCDAALSTGQNDYYAHTPTTIAQILSKQLTRKVYAYDVGLYFSNLDANHDTYFNGIGRTGPSTLPDYLIPEGSPRGKPNPLVCTAQACGKQ